MRAEAAERENEIQKQKHAEVQQELEDRYRSQEANMQHLKEKIEKEREKMLEEQDEMVKSKLRVNIMCGFVSCSPEIKAGRRGCLWSLRIRVGHTPKSR